MTLSELKMETGRQDLNVDESPIQQPNLVDRILVNLGARRPAVQVRRSGWRAPSEFYWFKCSRCHKITCNYIHGYNGIVPCNHCEQERWMQITALRNSKCSNKAQILVVVKPKINVMPETS
jgi:ribosomal protein S27E